MPIRLRCVWFDISSYIISVEKRLHCIGFRLSNFGKIINFLQLLSAQNVLLSTPELLGSVISHINSTLPSDYSIRAVFSSVTPRHELVIDAFSILLENFTQFESHEQAIRRVVRCLQMSRNLLTSGFYRNASNNYQTS